jgi:two-component system chemotaxis response regulator CheB
MIRVLIAEDSLTTRELLVAILRADPEVEVVGEAKDGIEAVEMTKRLRPDVVTMDIEMPRMDGFQATKRIMVEAPVPIVIVSASVHVREVEIAMRAMGAGALAVLPKPAGPAAADFDGVSRAFVETIKAMAQVKVVGHWPEWPQPAPIPARPAAGARCRAVAIAASTGGPAALRKVLADLPADYPAPILLVQHIATGFLEGLAAWLDTVSALRVKVAEHAEPLAAGIAYLAPDGRHLGVSKRGAVELSLAPPIGGFRPSANFLFESIARAFGDSAVAVVLTGMGNDGAVGLRAVREAGGRTIAQDEKSSVVFGMPSAAIESGAAQTVLPLSEIAAALLRLAARKKERT